MIIRGDNTHNPTIVGEYQPCQPSTRRPTRGVNFRRNALVARFCLASSGPPAWHVCRIHRLPIALKPLQSAWTAQRKPLPCIRVLACTIGRLIVGLITITVIHWLLFHQILIFISFNCVSETPSHSLLTVKETAEYLRIPLPTVYYLVQRGQIPAIQIGGRWRIKKSSLDRDILREDKQGQPTVLVVDDDLGIQELFKTFLKKTGFSRVVVGTAKEAISSLRKQKFDLMFLDLQLPDEPGDQVYKTAKQIDPGLNVIVITGYPDSKVLDRILQISPVTVLKKPLKIEQLNQTVKMLGHKAALVEA